MVKVVLEQYLKAEDIAQLGNVAVVVGEGKWLKAEDTGFDNDVLQIPVEFEGKGIREWTLNFTSLKAMVNAYGDETKNWVGKGVHFEVVAQMVAGKKKQVLYGEPIDVSVD